MADTNFWCGRYLGKCPQVSDLRLHSHPCIRTQPHTHTHVQYSVQHWDICIFYSHFCTEKKNLALNQMSNHVNFFGGAMSFFYEEESAETFLCHMPKVTFLRATHWQETPNFHITANLPVLPNAVICQRACIAFSWQLGTDPPAGTRMRLSWPSVSLRQKRPRSIAYPI